MPEIPDPILVLPEDDRPIYAVGDVHGMLAELGAMMALIEADAAARLTATGARPLALLLGDYVDRGPASLDALQLIRRRSLDRSGPVEWIALMGNHEALMLDALSGDSGALLQWLANGGMATLHSAGLVGGGLPDPEDLARAAWRRHGALLDWVAALPALAVVGSLDRPSRLFAHAGIDPRRPLARQERAVLLWTRAHRPDADYPCLLVHGHTIVPEVEVGRRRLNLDTGCFAPGGRLSAARLEPGHPPVLLQVERDSLRTSIRRTAARPTAA